ncbi:MAG: hypothetical protein K8W52_23720 [Deltaproteobacteria bacterium]|nr:hypothetical protein [Deltaproteobacteria bacterium]
MKQSIVITELGMVFCDHVWRFVAFAQVRSFRLVSDGLEKLAMSDLRLDVDGAPVVLRVAGGGPKHRDVFEFYRFVRGAMHAHRPAP